MEKTILIAADLHCGSVVGLCPRGVQIDRGGTYRLSRGQSWLLDCWEQVGERVEKMKDPVIIFNGDAVDQDTKNRSYEMITRNKATILRIATDVIQPMVQKCTAYYFTRGTPAHSGKSAWGEEELANDLGAVKNGEEASWVRLYLKIGQIKIDIAHHASLSGLPYGVVGAAERMASKIILQYHDQGEKAPDLVIRSHNHKWADSGTDHRTRVIYTGAFCLPGEHSQRLGFDLADIGALIIHCDDEHYEVEKMKFKPGGRIWQKI